MSDQESARNDPILPIGRPLSKMQEAFVVAYLANGGNATQAAITAGYSKTTARSKASDLLKEEPVQARIHVLTARALEEAEVIRTGEGEPRNAPDSSTSALAAVMNTQYADVESLARQRARVLARLEAIAFTELSALATWDADSVQFIPSDQLASEARGSVQSVKAKIDEVITDEGDKIIPRTTMEIKQHSPMPALTALLALLGMIPGDDAAGTKGSVAVGVQVILMGGATGIEALESGSRDDVTSKLVDCPTHEVPNSKNADIAISANPPTPRPWYPGPRKKRETMASVAAAARAAAIGR